MPDLPSVRLAIPAFNEAARLPVYLRELEKSGILQEPGVEIIVVDDGSCPSQGAMMKKAVEDTNKRSGVEALRYMRLGKNCGKGAAVYTAWDEPGNPALVGFLDSDGAVPAYEALRLLNLSRNGCNECLFASRVKMLGRTVDRSVNRHLFGRVFASLVGTFIHSGVYDSQCGLKIIPAAAYRKIRHVLREQRFLFDVELLAALLDAAFPVREVPVDWKDVPGSKVHLLRDSIRMLCGIFRISKHRKHWKF